jgi:hypothetical protein
MTHSTLFSRPALAAALWLAACAPAPTGGLPAPGASSTPVQAPSVVPSVAASVSPSAPAGFSVRGFVFDLDRAPVAGATVTARVGETLAGTSLTAADGSYALTLPAGRYDLTAAKDGLTRRTRAVDLAGDATFHFGPQPNDLGNPFFLADDPEIEAVTVEERQAGQGMAVTLTLSEPLVETGRRAFADAFRLYAGTETEFLKVMSTSVARRKLETSWDASGRAFTARYAGPYLASGETDTHYAVALLQDELEDEKDPVTRETKWEDLGLVDAAGRSLGRGQTRYAFKKAELFPLGAQQLTDPVFGYYVQDRRWRLTHEGRFRFRAKRDETPPSLVSAQLRQDSEVVGNVRADILTLTFSEPMSAAKDGKELYWTRLDKERSLVVLNVSSLPAGPEFKPLGASVQLREVIVDRADPRVVELHYPSGTFEDLKRVEVTLGPDMRDPAGNRPDPEKSKAVVTVN